MQSKTTDSISYQLRAKFKPYLQGDWVSSEYIEDIKKNKSPYKSYKNSGLVELQINIKNSSKRSVEVLALTLHEGGNDFSIFFRQGLTDSTLPTNRDDFMKKSHSYEIGYSISNKDTFLILYCYSKGKKLLEQTRYERCIPYKDGGVPSMVNKLMFAGKYTITDDKGRKFIALFTDDSKLKGFPNYKTYEVISDYATDRSNFDEICFDIQTKNQKCYAYKIKEDAIYLYEILEDSDDYKFHIGKKKYKLIKTE